MIDILHSIRVTVFSNNRYLKTQNRCFSESVWIFNIYGNAWGSRDGENVVHSVERHNAIHWHKLQQTDRRTDRHRFTWRSNLIMLDHVSRLVTHLSVIHEWDQFVNKKSNIFPINVIWTLRLSLLAFKWHWLERQWNEISSRLIDFVLVTETY